jgi:PAS domain S-box-containing protein
MPPSSKSPTGSGTGPTPPRSESQPNATDDDLYRAIVEDLGDAVFLADSEADVPSGPLLLVNHRACEQLGYAREELLALSARQLDALSGLFDASHVRALRSGDAIRYEAVQVTKVGREVPVEVDARAVHYGAKAAVLAVVRDVAERKKAEEDRRRRAQGLATVVEVSRSLAATLDLASVLQATTDGATKLSGVDSAAIYLVQGDEMRLWATTPPLPPDFPEELRGGSLADHPRLHQALVSGIPVLVPDVQAADLSPRERAVIERRNLRTLLFIPLVAQVKREGVLIVGSTGTPRSIVEPESELCLTLANLGALAVENARLYEASRQDAAALERALSARDRAERERLDMERQLLHAQKLESLGLLAGGVAHDFNNLLLAILGNLDLARLDLEPSSAAAKRVAQSIRATRRGTELARQLLAYSGKGRFVVEPVDVSRMVEDNARLLEASMARNVTLRLDLHPSLPSIEADPGQVHQVIMNLITNASEAIGAAEGSITLATGACDCDAGCLSRSRVREAAQPGRFVFAEARDTGCGMDAHTQERLFDPFFSTKGAGRGLGMAAIQGIVRGHRGAVLVDSAEGRGTTIRVLFPVLEAPPGASDGSAAAVAPDGGDRTLRGTILVVDDDELVREVCRGMVEALGLEVLVASNGHEAIDVLRREAHRVSHVILDLSMPGLDGTTTFQELVRIKPDVRVILSSGYNEQDCVQRLHGRGLAGFIQKPYSTADLQAILEKVSSAPA